MSALHPDPCASDVVGVVVVVVVVVDAVVAMDVGARRGGSEGTGAYVNCGNPFRRLFLLLLLPLNDPVLRILVSFLWCVLIFFLFNR